jgi:drug/metabolite transporter (DMT)-like permease
MRYWGSYGALVLAAACWGLGTVLTKNALAALPPFTLAVVQLTASCLFLWLLLGVWRLVVPWNGTTLRLSLSGLLDPGLTITLTILGLSFTTASMTTLLFAAQPLVIIVLAWLLLREPLRRSLLLCATIATFGVVLVAGRAPGVAGSASVLGTGLILAAVLCCSLYLVITRQAIAQIKPLVLVTIQQTVGLLWALTMWPLDGWLSAGVEWSAISTEAWIWASISGIVYYGLGFVCYCLGLRALPASKAAPFLSLTSLFGVGGAYLLLGERLSALQWLGALLIIGAMGLLAQLQLRAETLAQAQQPVVPT